MGIELFQPEPLFSAEALQRIEREWRANPYGVKPVTIVSGEMKKEEPSYEQRSVQIVSMSDS